MWSSAEISSASVSLGGIPVSLDPRRDVRPERSATRVASGQPELGIRDMRAGDADDPAAGLVNRDLARLGAREVPDVAGRRARVDPAGVGVTPKVLDLAGAAAGRVWPPDRGRSVGDSSGGQMEPSASLPSPVAYAEGGPVPRGDSEGGWV